MVALMTMLTAIMETRNLKPLQLLFVVLAISFYDSNFSNKSKKNIRNDLTGTQSNKDLIEALKSKLLDEFMPYIKHFHKRRMKI